MLRKIVKIDEEKCDGCGLCIPNCAEGALQIIDGKARLISDLFCDGLGACLGYCPQEAITIEERAAEPYDENKVMDYIIQGGDNVIKAHLHHLHDHKEMGYLNQALTYLRNKNINIPEDFNSINSPNQSQGCPGSRSVELKPEKENTKNFARANSQLSNWPVQLHLLNPRANYFTNNDLLLAADCTAYAAANFHEDFLEGRILAIACPKLDSNKDIYLEKLQVMIEESGINSITVVIMEVPCCRGLLQIAQQAIQTSKRKVPLRVVVMSIRGEVVLEEEI